MKVVYPTCCGVDVHKTFLVATIIKTTSIIQPSYSKKRFSTFNNSIREFKTWLIQNECFDVCMESTGKYWVPVYNVLEGEIRVTIANPKWVKAVKGNKDDTKDSKWIGDLFRLGLVPGSYIPDKEIRLLREYTRYRSKLVSQYSSEKNRLQNAFTVCNVALDAVVSDMFGVSATNITDYLITADVFNPAACASLLRGSLKKKEQQVLQSIDGYQMTAEQKNRISLIKEHMTYIQTSITNLDKTIQSLAMKYESEIKLLTTCIGIDKRSAITIISEIGTDMRQFQSSKKLCCWAGLTPGNNESAGKKKSVRITRAGVYLKPALVQVAHAAVKSKLSPYYRIKYESISKRRGKKRAIIAIARMILTAIYHMLLTGEFFNPSDFRKDFFDHEQLRQSRIKSAILYLQKQGIYSLSSSDIILEPS